MRIRPCFLDCKPAHLAVDVSNVLNVLVSYDSVIPSLFSLHIVSCLSYVCDRVIRAAAGCLLGQGTPEKEIF